TGKSPAPEPGGDEFVVVTTDMCPPASLVSSSVISGVGAAEAQNAVRAAASLDGGSQRPAGQMMVPGVQRMRAQTHLSKSTEHLLLRRMATNGYTDSSESLVRISTPSLSASSSEASLPLGQGAAGARAQMQRRKPPAPLLTGIRPQHNLQLPANSALGNGFKPPLPGAAGSARKVSACSFSSLEDQRRDALHGTNLENLSPYTVNRLNTTAAKATERRRRSSVHRMRRMRTGSSASSGTWGLSAASDATLLPDAAARPSHARNMSDNSRLSVDYDLHSGSQQSFDFQIQSAVSESFWQHDESPLASDLDDDDEEDGLAAMHDVSGFPSSCSAHFDFGPDSGLSPRPRAHTTANAARSPDALRFDSQGYSPLSPEAVAVLGMLDPSSPLYDDGGALVPLHMLTRSQSRLRRMSDVEPASPFIPEQFDYDGSTLTQQSDWLLMNPSSSDGEQSLQPQHRRRMRKRRVLPRTLFQTGPSKPALGADEQMYRNSKSTETLSAGGNKTEAKAKAKVKALLAKTHAVADQAADVAPSASSSTPVAREEAASHLIVLTEDAVRMCELRIILRLPASIALHVHIECVGSLTLLCAGDSRCWQSARIACFAQRLNACLRGATGLRELSLLNLGLTAVPRGVQAARGLRRLDLSHNWVCAVPSWIACMAQLEHLVLRDNALRTVAADLVEMRHRLRTLDLGGTGGWAVLSRAATPARLSAHERSEALLARLHATAAKRMAACLTATQFSLTQRQHEASRDRATRLLAHYADSIYSSLREPRSWGHS
ncbi:hypothetical protein J3B02_004148, partial [Coemansia erecta]